MTSGNGSWSGVVLAATVFTPGVVAFILLVFVRSWMRNQQYRRRQKRKMKD